MRVLVLLLLMGGISSCCSVYTLTEINCCGPITSSKPTASEDGDMLYTVRVDKSHYIEYTTYGRFRQGDTICFTAKGELPKK
jgi:hypothetical protein